MNKRIKELMIKSGAYDHYEVNEGVNGDELPMVKFAELIVRECAKAADEGLAEVTMKGPEWPSHYIKKHFGVEE